MRSKRSGAPGARPGGEEKPTRPARGRSAPPPVWILACLGGAFGCTGAAPVSSAGGAATAKASASASEGAGTSAPPASASAPVSASAAPSSAPAPPSAAPPSVSVASARELLVLDEAGASQAGADACTGEPEVAVSCLLGLRYANDAAARASALELWQSAGSVAGLEQAHRMDGGWRGGIDIVPELPVARHAHHVAWVLDANRDFARFFAALAERSSATIGYRYRAIGYRFMRSVNRTTPSAYAHDWQVGYNVSGSLNVSKDAVRETLFHEIFHLNDATHDFWSERTLSSLYDDIMARCATPGVVLPRHDCLTPYAPGTTTVRGGTYYAFTPGNGVGEYAAELAIRYYREQRGALGLQPVAGKRFKCGPAENAQAWRTLVDEFFAGVDLTPPCP